VKKPTVIEEEPHAKKPKAAEPRQILTRAVRSEQKAEKELLQINAEIERLNKRKAELEANDSVQMKRC
jgi:plasmid stability protein